MLRAFRCAFIPLLILLLALAPFGSFLGIGLLSHQSLPVITEAWQVLDEYYVDQGKLNSMRLAGGAVTGMFHSLFDTEEGLTEGAIDGMLDTLNDSYTYYLTAEEFEQLLQSYYQGGTTVEWIMLDDIAYIRIFRFSDSTDDELSSALSDAIGQGAKGIILDLRGNLGGLVDSAVLVTSEFLDEGDLVIYAKGHGVTTKWVIMGKNDYIIVHELEGDIVKKELEIENADVPEDMPVAILVNGYTASAAEMVAGVLQDYGTELIGTETYGKGSICYVVELSDGSALCVTSSRWYTPVSDYCVEGTGLTPDKEGGLEEAIKYIEGENAGSSLAGLFAEGVLLNV